MTVIKAIETRYKGYRFRSRLEARWAVFFDALGIDWRYEEEGYVLEDGSRYLPDFFLPEFEWHAEVKPYAPSGEDAAKMKLFDNKPPPGSLGLLYLIGVPGEFTVDEYRLCDGGSQSTWHFLVRTIGIADHSRIIDAVRAARSARFEHGESGMS